MVNNKPHSWSPFIISKWEEYNGLQNVVAFGWYVTNHSGALEGSFPTRERAEEYANELVNKNKKYSEPWGI